MHVVELVRLTALRRCVACCLQWRSSLDDSAANVVGLLQGLMVVVMRGTLMGLNLEISVGDLGIGAYGCMEHMICLFSLVWGM